MIFTDRTDTIAAVCTAPGMGAIAVIRISGTDAIAIANTLWRGKPLADAPSHTAHLGYITDTAGGDIDQAVATVFRAPNSYTGENTVELSCHGSTYIQQAVLNALVDSGVRIALPGEFSQRAFANGKVDLTQAEGIADLIASRSAEAHRLALSQTKGAFSHELDTLRQKLIDLASLIELELDFSEEDVAFADRTQLLELCEYTLGKVTALADSYAQGRVIRDGYPVAIVGAPNAGKSTLLNTLVGDDIAIVSQIPGTTRDAIQATTLIGGSLFRLIDTAGLRETDDTVERLGIGRTHRHIEQASAIVWLIDPTDNPMRQLEEAAETLAGAAAQHKIIAVGKSDLADTSDLVSHIKSAYPEYTAVAISSLSSSGIEPLLEQLHKIGDTASTADVTVTNARHYQALCETKDALERVRDGLKGGISGDFVAQDLRQATAALGTITGAVTTDTLLATIFSRFCVGK